MLTQDLIQNLKRLCLSKNMNLWSYVCLKGTFILNLKLQSREKEYTGEKRRFIEEICNVFKSVDLRCVRDLLNEVKEALIANGYRVKVCRVKAVSRVLVGASESFGKVPFEVGLFLDHILNVPFIPSSSLKGAFRHALIELIERRYKGSGVDGESIASEIFGSEQFSGLVGVTDAYPVEAGINGLIFEPDVITPHYPGARTEFDVKPTPISFLTVARGVEFEFFIYLNKQIYELEHRYIQRGMRRSRRKYAGIGIVDKLEKHRFSGERDFIGYTIYSGDLGKALGEISGIKKEDIIEVIPWIERAILYAFAKGVGAKTSVGYSRFMIVKYKWVEG